jgi:ketosteroid isomerase-like protein
VTSNIDVFLRSAEAANRGDVDRMLADIAEDVVVWGRRSAVAGEFRGHDGVREMFADNAESFEVWRVDFTDVRDLGDDRLLAIGTVHIKVRAGGVEMDAPSAGVVEFENGKIKRWHDYGDRGEALAAAGLSD